MVSCSLFRLDQGKIEASGLALKAAQLAVAAFGFELLDALFHIRLAPRKHGVDETGELVRDGLDGAGCIQPRRRRARWQAPMKPNENHAFRLAANQEIMTGRA